jgi:hypothetical protein
MTPSFAVFDSQEFDLTGIFCTPTAPYEQLPAHAEFAQVD